MTGRKKKTLGCPEGQTWNEKRASLTIRLPEDLELALRRLTLKSGDLSAIVSFALQRLDLTKLKVVLTRKTHLGLGSAIMVRITPSFRKKLKSSAQTLGVSINSVVVSALTALFKEEKTKAKSSLERQLIERLLAKRI